MKSEELDRILKEYKAKTEPTGARSLYTLEGGSTLTFHAAKSSVSLNVPKVEQVRSEGGLLFLKTARGDAVAMQLEDVFAVGLDTSSSTTAPRRAGFGGSP